MYISPAQHAKRRHVRFKLANNVHFSIPGRQTKYIFLIWLILYISLSHYVKRRHLVLIWPIIHSLLSIWQWSPSYWGGQLHLLCPSLSCFSVTCIQVPPCLQGGSHTAVWDWETVCKRECVVHVIFLEHVLHLQENEIANICQGLIFEA